MLLLDNGGVFPSSGSFLKLKAEVSLKAMSHMGYDAMNLGPRGFSLGSDVLKRLTSNIDFPLVTSNLVYKDSRVSFGEEYVIKDMGKMKVGPIGALETVRDPRSTENLEIISPEYALKSILPEVRKKADLVILLSQCGFEATSLLVNNLGAIDLAISGRGQRSELPCNNKERRVL